MGRKQRKKTITYLFLLLGAPVFLILLFLIVVSYNYYGYKKATVIPTTALIIDVIVENDIGLGMISVYERSKPIYCPVILFVDHENKIQETTVIEAYCSIQPIYKIGDTLPILIADRPGFSVRVPHIYENEYLRHIKVSILSELLSRFGINFF